MRLRIYLKEDYKFEILVCHIVVIKTKWFLQTLQIVTMKINDLEDLNHADWLRRLCWVVEQSKDQ